MKLADDLTCAELVELVTGYFEGGLSGQDKERFEEHIVCCAVAISTWARCARRLAPSGG